MVSLFLENRVLELALLSVDYLGPVGLLRVCEYPARVVLGFDYEDPKARHKDVINLGRAILQAQCDVIEKVIVGRRKLAPQNVSHELLTPVLVPGCTVSGKG